MYFICGAVSFLCDSNPCQNNATCQETVNDWTESYKCQCSQDYYGKHCEKRKYSKSILFKCKITDKYIYIVKVTLRPLNTSLYCLQLGVDHLIHGRGFGFSFVTKLFFGLPA